MRQRQSGITFIGWLFLLVPVAIVGYAGIRAAPYYLNYYKVVKTMKQVATEFEDQQQISQVALHRAVERRYDIETISNPPIDDIKVERNGSQRELHVNYDDIVPLFGHMSLLLTFDIRTPIK